MRADEMKPGHTVNVKSKKPLYSGKAIFVSWFNDKKHAMIQLGNGSRIKVERAALRPT